MEPFRIEDIDRTEEGCREHWNSFYLQVRIYLARIPAQERADLFALIGNDVIETTPLKVEWRDMPKYAAGMATIFHHMSLDPSRRVKRQMGPEEREAWYEAALAGGTSAKMVENHRQADLLISGATVHTIEEFYKYALEEFNTNYPFWPRRDGSCDHEHCARERERKQRLVNVAVKGGMKKIKRNVEEKKEEDKDDRWARINGVAVGVANDGPSLGGKGNGNNVNFAAGSNFGGTINLTQLTGELMMD